MEFKGFISKKDLDKLSVKLNGDCYCLTEDCTIEELIVKKGEIILRQNNKWLNMSDPNQCCRISRDITAQTDVGYITSGDIIKEGTTFTDVFNRMFRENK